LHEEPKDLLGTPDACLRPRARRPPPRCAWHPPNTGAVASQVSRRWFRKQRLALHIHRLVQRLEAVRQRNRTAEGHYWVVAWWANQFGVSEEALLAAVAKVGVRADMVELYLDQHKTTRS
jgi:hypothetical protein